MKLNKVCVALAATAACAGLLAGCSDSDDSDDSGGSAAATTFDDSATTSPDAAASAGHWTYGASSATLTSGDASLKFESDPTWGRTVDLTVTGETFDCALGCSGTYSLDGKEPAKLRLTLPTAPPPHLSLADPEPKDFWAGLDGARTLKITYPGAKGERSAEFDLAGYDRSKLSGY